MKRLTIPLVLLISACGTELDFERPVIEKTPTFIEVESCTGLSAYQPAVNYVDNSDWQYGQNSGWYANGVVYINAVFSDQVKLLKGEFVHHLLQVNYGDLNPSHLSPLFYQCT